MNKKSLSDEIYNNDGEFMRKVIAHVPNETELYFKIEDVRKAVKKLKYTCHCDNEKHPEWKGTCFGCKANEKINQIFGEKLI